MLEAKHVRSCCLYRLGWLLVSFAAFPLPDLLAQEDDYYAREAATTSRVRLRPVPDGVQLDRLIRRDPIALQLVDDDRRLIVATAASGSLLQIDLASGAVQTEANLAKRFSQLVALENGRWLLATDEDDHGLLLIERTENTFRLAAKVDVPQYPVGLAVDTARGRIYVASLWSRRLAMAKIDCDARPPALRVESVVDLPFAPRRLLLVEQGRRLIVADAFGGKLGLFDTHNNTLERVRELPAHHIRGLTVSHDGRRVLVAHQILNDLAETTHNDVHWGVLMSNVLRWIPLQGMLDPRQEILAKSHVHLTGDNTSAGGDPAEAAISPDGRAVVALAGVNQIGIGYETDFTLKRLEVGQRPTAVVIAANGRNAYVANTFDDTISVIDLDRGVVQSTISLGHRRRPTEAERGELLFYDARLALDGWFSCHSCHTDGHSNGFLADTRGDNSFGAAKRVLPLGGVTETGPWGWNGQQPSMSKQINQSINSTMQGTPLAKEDTDAIFAFLKSLEPPPSLAAARNEQDHPHVLAGQKLFSSLGCASCHQPPTYTSSGAYDVGLVDKLGNRQFNPPSLRGVSQRAPLFHDNRADSLEDVLVKYRHQLEKPLTRLQQQQLLAFLRSL